MKKNILIGVALSFLINISMNSQDIGWQRKFVETTANLNSVTFFEGNWIVGDNGTILKDFYPLDFNCTQNLNKIKFSFSYNYGYIVGDSGTIISCPYYGVNPSLTLINSNTNVNLHDIAYTNNDSIVIIVGDSGTILLSSTKNVNFKIVSNLKNYDLTSVSFTQHGNGWAVGSSGTILKTTDGGETWAEQISNTTNNLTTVNFFDKYYGWAAGDKSTLLFTSDGGNSWINSNLNYKSKINGCYFPTEHLSSVITNLPELFQETQNIYSLVTNSTENIYFYYRSYVLTQGVKFINENGVINDYAPKGYEVFFTDLKFNKGDTLFAARGVHGIFYIPQKGIAPSVWAVIPDIDVRILSIDLDSQANIWASCNKDSIYCVTPAKEITIFPIKQHIKKLRINNDFLYGIVTDSNLIDEIWRFKIFSNDSLGTPELFFCMSELTNVKPAEIFDFIFDVNSDLIISSNTYSMVNIIYPDKSYKSILQNFSFQTGYFKISNEYLAIGGKAKNDLYLSFNAQTISGDYSDLYKLSLYPLLSFKGFLVGDNGKIITKASDDTVWNEQLSSTNLDLNSIYFTDNLNGVVVGDSGLVLTTSDGGMTGINNHINTADEIVSDYKLFQNFPNPFNPSTKIKYSIPVGAQPNVNVQIKVYDILGNEVITLVNEYKSAGYYQINWNGKNNTGDKVTSGIYIYRIVAGNFIQSKKMILLK